MTSVGSGHWSDNWCSHAHSKCRTVAIVRAWSDKDTSGHCTGTVAHLRGRDCTVCTCDPTVVLSVCVRLRFAPINGHLFTDAYQVVHRAALSMAFTCEPSAKQHHFIMTQYRASKISQLFNFVTCCRGNEWLFSNTQEKKYALTWGKHSHGAVK